MIPVSKKEISNPVISPRPLGKIIEEGSIESFSSIFCILIINFFVNDLDNSKKIIPEIIALKTYKTTVTHGNKTE